MQRELTYNCTKFAIKSGCKAHIVYNWANAALGVLPVDAKHIVVKVFEQTVTRRGLITSPYDMDILRSFIDTTAKEAW